MAELQPIKRVVKELEETGVDEGEIYVDPKTVHVIAPDDDDWED